MHHMRKRLAGWRFAKAMRVRLSEGTKFVLDWVAGQPCCRITFSDETIKEGDEAVFEWQTFERICKAHYDHSPLMSGMGVVMTESLDAQQTASRAAAKQ